MGVRLEPQERDELYLHLDHLRTIDALREAIRVACGATYPRSRNTITRALRGELDISLAVAQEVPTFLDDSAETLRKLSRQRDHDGLLRLHDRRYTGMLLRGVKPGVKDDAILHSLHEEVSVTKYKRGLMRAIKYANEHATESTEHPTSSKLPQRIAFIAHTGQWLKPILRSLIQHPHPVHVDVYLTDPQRPSLLPNGTPEAAEVLGTMEFLWSLPAILDLGDKSTGHGSIHIFCYRGALADDEFLPKRMALFEGDLVCQTEEGRVEKKASSQFAGHPGSCVGARRTKCPPTIEIALRGHKRFDKLISDFHALTGSGSDRLPGLSAEPLLTWDSRKGFGGRACTSKGTAVFNIDPMRMFPDSPGGFMELNLPKPMPTDERCGPDRP